MPSPTITCSGCGASWTAATAAHCAGCHLTFAGVSLFDRHRTARGEHGSCVEPEEIRNAAGYRDAFFRNDMWRGREMTDDEKRARFNRG